MKCDKCGRELKPGEHYFRAVGFILCKECDEKSGHSVSLDDILSKMKSEERFNPSHESR